jgi:methionyl-tRNA formyltransferase
MSLTAELADAGAELLVRTLRTGLGTPVPQSGEVTHAAKISRDELKIDWSRTAEEIRRQVRAVRAFTEIDGQRLRVLEVDLGPSDSALAIGVVDSQGCVGTGDGTVSLRRVQPEGKSAMDADSWLRGRPHGANLRFT